MYTTLFNIRGNTATPTNQTFLREVKIVIHCPIQEAES